MATARKLPSRLHHTAYVSKNLEETRKFYEDIIGLPLMATWCESDMLFGAERTGLTNEELKFAHALLRIPTSEEYASLNVAMSVLIIAYELLRARREVSVPVMREHLGILDAIESRDPARAAEAIAAHIANARNRALGL